MRLDMWLEITSSLNTVTKISLINHKHKPLTVKRIACQLASRKLRHLFSRLSVTTAVHSSARMLPVSTQGTIVILTRLMSDSRVPQTLRGRRSLSSFILHKNLPQGKYSSATSNSQIALKRLWTRPWFWRTSSRSLSTGTKQRCKSWLQCYSFQLAKYTSGIGIAVNPIHITTISSVMRQSKQQSNSSLLSN